MPHQTEPSANTTLGNLLQPMLGKALVHSENTQVIEGHAGYHPDILITATGRSHYPLLPPREEIILA